MRAHEGGTRLGEDPEELHAGHRKSEASIQSGVCDGCSSPQPARSRRHPGVVVSSKGYRKLIKGKTWKGFEKDMERKQPSAVRAGKKKVKEDLWTST